MQMSDLSTNSFGRARLAVILLLVILVGACTPNRPKQVPGEAQYNPKGGVAWTYCEPKGHVKTLPLSRCIFFDSAGSEILSTMNVSLNHLEELERNEVIWHELMSWDVTWWKGAPLFRIFSVEHYASTGILDNEEYQSVHMLKVVADTCLEFLQGDPLTELEKLLENHDLEININNVPIEFSDQLEPFQTDLSPPSRVSHASKCRALYYYVSVKGLSDLPGLR
jgi:hypothetical protein